MTTHFRMTWGCWHQATAASGSQVTSLRQFRVTCEEKAVQIQLRLRSPDANGRVMHFILRRHWGGCRSPSRSQKSKNGIRSHLESAETHTLRHQGWGKCLHSFFEGDMGAESPLKVKSSNLETAFPGSIQEGKFHSLGGSQFTEPQCHSDS